MNRIAIGYQAIVEKLSLNTLPHYRQSYIVPQGRRQVLNEYGIEVQLYPKSYALQDGNGNNLLENLEFALKHDGINLEVIHALFQQLETSQLVNYIRQQPTGIYSRKIWYLYEFLMDKQLPLKDCQRIKYVDLLNPDGYFTAEGIKSARHGVNDNLLGNRYFCPLLRRTPKIEKYIKLKLDDKANSLLEQYDSQVILRACHYLYTKETMSSYQIEREQPNKSRTIRFINLLKNAAHQSNESLTKTYLIELQNAIVDPRFKDVDYRNNQNYVGENIRIDQQIIHYISPKPEDVKQLMQGLFDSLQKMLSSKVHPVIIAATISFGFVFIHPFEDGNGRIHRFLIHDILSRTGFTPADLIFPVSAVMLNNEKNYDDILASFSKPLLAHLTDYYLSNEGIMTVQEESRSYYSFIDFTKIVEYLFECIEEAIEHHFTKEIQFLVDYDKVKAAIQDIVDMPDKEIDLLIKLVTQNKGTLSSSKRNRFFYLLNDNEIEKITSIIQKVMC